MLNMSQQSSPEHFAHPSGKTAGAGREIPPGTGQALQRIPNLQNPKVEDSPRAFRALCRAWCCYHVLLKSREIKFPMKGNECSPVQTPELPRQCQQCWFYCSACGLSQVCALHSINAIRAGLWGGGGNSPRILSGG